MSPISDRSALFGATDRSPTSRADLIDALVLEIDFALGIEAALRGVEVIDVALMNGVMEITRAHTDRLRAIGRAVERVLS
jgi:hypothetical protein